MIECSREFVEQAERESWNMPVFGDPRFPPSVYYRLFQALVAKYRPEIMVELGTCGGGASLHLALGCPEGRVVSFDLDCVSYASNIEFIQNLCPNFEFRVGDSVEGADSFEDGSVGFLFIDTTHTYEQTTNEYSAWLSKLKHGGVVVLDDIRRGGMDDVIADVERNPRTRDVLIYHRQGGDGMAVVLV